MDCGAYQYHMDPTLTIDGKYKKGGYIMKPAALASDIFNYKNGLVPVAPSLCMANDLDGTCTPSYENHNGHTVVKVNGITRIN